MLDERGRPRMGRPAAAVCSHLSTLHTHTRAKRHRIRRDEQRGGGGGGGGGEQQCGAIERERELKTAMR